MTRSPPSFVSAITTAVPAVIGLMLCPPSVRAADEVYSTFVSNYCLDCHGEDVQEGEFLLPEEWSSPVSSAAAEHQFRLLEQLADVVRSGRMPPEDAGEQPDASARATLREWIEKKIDAIAARQQDDPGPVVLARLTRDQYRNVIADLSGGIVNDAGRFLPNEGGAGEGFANVGEAQAHDATVVERMIAAAKGVLMHLRASPVDGIRWEAVPRESVADRREEIAELRDDIIGWHVGQQQRWGAEHRRDLEAAGPAEAVYLKAAWEHHHQLGDPADSTPRSFAERARQHNPPLAPVALRKWYHILTAEKPPQAFAAWAEAWRRIPVPPDAEPTDVLAACRAIVLGDDASTGDAAPFAPPYEISFREAAEEVLETATNEHAWPFRIDVTNLRRVFLVAADAGDGNDGDYGIWRLGRVQFADGTTKPWQEAVDVRGGRSGKPFPFGFDSEGSAIGPDAIGVRPPGVLVFDVPPGATLFEVEMARDSNRTQRASMQALILDSLPDRVSHFPGRPVFGGRPSRKAKLSKELHQALRKRNLPEAMLTKVGLNAERNVFAAWAATPLEAIGGPWTEQHAELSEPSFPYHYTVSETVENAGPAAAADLRLRQARLAAAAEPPSPAAVTPDVEGWITEFATRAWRRPPERAEIDWLVGLFQSSDSGRLAFDAAVKKSLLAVLVSPWFVYPGLYPDHGLESAEASAAESGRPPATVQPLSGPERASRLSFFLWGSLPDERLVSLGRAGALMDPAVMAAEARRLLADGRSRSLATDFAGQLWDFAGFLDRAGPDPDHFPEFTPELRRSMWDEVVTFLDDLFRHDRPLTAIIDADYTFADRRLARHYGVGVVSGTGISRIPLAADRGGLSGMALFLSQTSAPLRTSPVQRGVWVLERLLGHHIPTPPPLTVQLSEGPTNEAGLGIVEQLAAHRESAACSSCHRQIDPPGLALEVYDPIGRLRSTPPAATASDPATPAELRRWLAAQREDVFSHFNRKLLGYALGRGIGPGDRPLLRTMDRSLAESDYRLSAVVSAIVTSPQFLMRRSTVASSRPSTMTTETVE